MQQLLSMWELLAELESLCARYACERMTDEERAVLRQLRKPPIGPGGGKEWAGGK